MLRRSLHTTIYRLSNSPSIESPVSHSATVVLTSGGLESTALLSYWKHWNHQSYLIPIFVNYGQPNAVKEGEAARYVCQHLDLQVPQVLNVNMLKEQFKGMQRGEPHHNRSSFRNLMLLSLAAASAANAGADSVAIALSKDTAASSDSTLSFIRHANSIFQTSDPPISLLAPVIQMDTQHVVDLGNQVNAPFELSWSCLGSGEKHCGECPRCKVRKQVLGSGRWDY